MGSVQKNIHSIPLSQNQILNAKKINKLNKSTTKKDKHTSTIIPNLPICRKICAYILKGIKDAMFEMDRMIHTFQYFITQQFSLKFKIYLFLR